MKNFPRILNHGSGHPMVLDNTKLLFFFKKSQNEKEIETLLKEYQLRLIQPGKKNNSALRSFEIVNHNEKMIWVEQTNRNAFDEERYQQLIKALKTKVEWIGPVYRLQPTESLGSMLCPAPNILVVEFHQRGDRQGTKKDVLATFTQPRKNAPELKEIPEKSKYLNGKKYYSISDISEQNAYAMKELLEREYRDVVKKVFLENIPVVRDQCFVPNDPTFATQWGLSQINCAQAWDITTGSATVSISVLDYGFDTTHPDINYLNSGIDLSTMMPDASGTDPHGTSCAGIIAANTNNSLGVAGIAGTCRILPLKRVSGSDVEVAAGINYAADNGASILSMSFGRYAPGEGFGPTGWDFTLIDPAIEYAVNTRNCVLCAATGNEDTSVANRYPSRHSLVVACGASSTDDNRKTTTSPDGEGWGSNFANTLYNGVTTGVSIVAPGVLIPTTDVQGTAGYNNAAGTAGDYFNSFNGTSSATPHVAGVAALIRSQYPALTNIQVREILERTADKVGTLPYAETAGKNSGTWNQEMGYGRLNAFRTLDFADTMIKDWDSDNGTEPSNPPGGNFWDFSDVVVRINDDNVFNPSNPSQSKNVERGQSNFIYVRVTNNGPREARNVSINCRITPWVGTQFAYPSDWTTTDAMHVAPASILNTFPTIASGSTVIAKFSVTAAQTDTLYGWQNDHPWHPCLLASVTADNDYAFASSGFTIDPLSRTKNNLAQRNLTVIDVLADTTDAAIAFPFIAGHSLNAERFMELTVDTSAMPPKAKMLLSLDDDGSIFPLIDFNAINKAAPASSCAESGIVYLEKTRIETTLGCCRGILTLEKGSRFECSPKRKLEPVKVSGGEVIIREGKRYVQLNERITHIRLEKNANHIYPLSVLIDFKRDMKKGQEYTLKVSQQNTQGTTVGGATAVYIGK